MILIEKDKILNQWVVWDKHKNYSVDLHKSNTKKEAQKWVKNHKRRCK